jgi:hypothetical protein
VASLSKREKADAREIFAAGNACPDCGGIHQRACPRVKRQVWVGQGSGAGNRVEVEYFPVYPDAGIIWPEDAYDEDDAEDANAG